MPPLFRTLLFLLLFLPLPAIVPVEWSVAGGAGGTAPEFRSASHGAAWAAPIAGDQGERPAPQGGPAPPLAEQLFSGSVLGALFFGYPFQGLGAADLAVIALLAFVLFRRFAPRRSERREEDGSSGQTGEFKWPERGDAPGPESRGGSMPDQGKDRLEWPKTGDQEQWPPQKPPSGETGEQRRLPTVQENAANAWARLRSTPSQAEEPHARAGAFPAAGNLPPGFDRDDFLEGARALYLRLEEAWATRRIEDIAPLVTEGMMRVIRSQADHAEAGRADILFINAALDGVTRQGNWEVAEVRFTVTMRESEQGGEHGEPVESREIWRIVRSPDTGNKWQLDGIRQA